MAQIIEGINFDSMKKILDSKTLKHKHIYYNADCKGVVEDIKGEPKSITFLVRFTLCDYLSVVVIQEVYTGYNDGFRLFCN